MYDWSSTCTIAVYPESRTIPVNETPSQIDLTTPPGPVVNPGSEGIFGNADTETAFAGVELPAPGGP
jgi:hypothetical protein